MRMRKIDYSVFHSSTHGTDIPARMAQSDLYRFMLGIHKLSGGKLVCAQYDSTTMQAVITDQIGWPIYAINCDGGRYKISSTFSGRWSIDASAKSYNTILNTLKKNNPASKKTSYFWDSYWNRDGVLSAGSVVAWLNRMVLSVTSSFTDVSSWRIRSMIDSDSIMWLLSVYTGRVQRTDRPPARDIRQTLDNISAEFNKIMRGHDEAAAQLMRMAGRTKWIVSRIDSRLGHSGYIVGAVDCSGVFAHKAQTVTFDADKPAVLPTQVVPFKYYRTLDDLEPHFKADVMSQLHMVRMQHLAQRPNAMFDGDYFPADASEVYNADGGWCSQRATMATHLLMDAACLS